MNSHKKGSATINFEQLVNTYYQPLYRFAYSLSKNESDACDLTQETFYIWARKGSSLRDTSKVKSWLFTTLYREFLRSRRRIIRESQQEEWEDVEDNTACIQPDLVNTLDSAEAITYLADLDSIYKEPLTLFYLKQFSYKEISEILEIPLGTVMSRISRGKAALKKKFFKSSPSSAK